MTIFFALINIFTLFISLPLSIKFCVENRRLDALFNSTLCVIAFSLLFLHYLPLHWGLIEAN